MLKKITVLVMFSFLTLIAYADEKVNSIADGNVDKVIEVNENVFHQYFFVGNSQKNMVFRNATNKVMNFNLINLSDSSEGTVVVKCIQDENGTAQITKKVKPGDNCFPCKAQYSVELSYESKKGFASGIYNIVLTSPVPAPSGRLMPAR